MIDKPQLITGTRQELILLLEKVMSHFTDNSDMMWTSYETAAQVRSELCIMLGQLHMGDVAMLDVLNVHFAPTGTFQEHSIQNDWSAQYMLLAEKFDALYAAMK